MDIIIYLTQLERDDEVFAYLVNSTKNIIDYKVGQQLDHDTVFTLSKSEDIDDVINEREVMDSRRDRNGPETVPTQKR